LYSRDVQFISRQGLSMTKRIQQWWRRRFLRGPCRNVKTRREEEREVERTVGWWNVQWRFIGLLSFLREDC
jgi:hypothetical protein